ncbi:MAG: ABC transporter ATP-binding protein [Lachnospiraceae bacterium]|nr:ABC transporter ATP-binding protein [Lachnospiraceae bacterium]
MIVLKLTDIGKNYKNTGDVLKGVNLELESGKMYGIMGPSGSGKSTLLNIIGTLEKASYGTIEILGNKLEGYGEKELCDLRAKNIGYIFQNFYLNPYLDAVENVMVPMKINHEIEPKERRKKAECLLKKFGLEERMKHLKSQMSGGEQQRVAIARALANDPDIILADEPTGNLDEDNEIIIFKTLKELAESGKVVVVVSHNEIVKEYADEVIEIIKGRIKA